MELIKNAAVCTKLLVDMPKPIIFVPTMGYLHAGHISLIKKAKEYKGTVVVSIFVNPTQFAPTEDFDNYPRDIARDIKILQEEQADILFLPDVDQIYSASPVNEPLMIADKGLQDKLCGRSRVGHFDGVVTVVNKLFNIVNPDIAIFGKKDYQQYLIIQKMVADLKMNIKIIGAPIVREDDGLAMSSRNKYLSDEERIDALVLSRSLQLAKNMFKNGSSLGDVKKELFKTVESVKSAKIDYIEIVDAKNLKNVLEYKANNILVALAVYIGQTRLIDNIVI